jgi:hypothetical protein
MNTKGPATNWAVERRLANGPVVRLGTVRWVGDGYRFTPNVSGRKPSRKVHPTLADSLPRWVGYPNRCETRAL